MSPLIKLCPWCRTGLHDDCSQVTCDCTHEPTGDDMTAVPCPHCERSCAGPAGLASHIRSMHPEVVRAAEDRVDRDLARSHEAPPGPAGPTSNGIVWEDPPVRGGEVVQKVIGLLPALRTNPNRWARLYTWPGPSSATGFRKQLTDRDDVDLDGIELKSTKVDAGSALYGRYVEAE